MMGKAINIFTVGTSGVVNCWLGELSEDKIQTENI